MATIYMIAEGHDVAPEDMTPFDPQPRTEGMQYTRRQYAASGEVTDEGAFVEFLFSMIDRAAQYQGLLTQSGLLVAKSALVSIYMEDENYDGVVRNGRAVKPLIGRDGKRDNYFMTAFVFLVHSLQAQP